VTAGRPPVPGPVAGPPGRVALVAEDAALGCLRLACEPGVGVGSRVTRLPQFGESEVRTGGGGRHGDAPALLVAVRAGFVGGVPGAVHAEAGRAGPGGQFGYPGPARDDPAGGATLG